MDRFRITFVGELTDELVTDYYRRGYSFHFDGWMHGKPVHTATLSHRKAAA
jgi:hypothetical protein